MGDVKCLKDSVRNAGNICDIVSVEEEIAIPGHYCILKVNGGWINRVVLNVREQNVDAPTVILNFSMPSLFLLWPTVLYVHS